MNNLIAEKKDMEVKYYTALETHTTECAEAHEKHVAEREIFRSDHASKIVDLENSYEDRLIDIANKVSTLEEERKHQAEEHKQELTIQRDMHQVQLNELVSKHETLEEKLRSQINSLTDQVEIIEKMKEEMLTQQEEEYEMELSQHSFESHKRLRHKEHVIDDKNIEVQRLNSKKEQLFRQIKELKAKVANQHDAFVEESKRCKILEDELKRLKAVVEERGETIAKTEALMYDMK